MQFKSNISEIISKCKVICSNELILYNDSKLEAFYNDNFFWLEAHYPFKSHSELVQLTYMLRHQMPALFGLRGVPI